MRYWGWKYLLNWLSKVLAYVSFSSLGKILEDRFILTHSFRGFSLWSANFTAFRLVIRQKCHGRRNGEKKNLTSWNPGSRDWRKGQRQDTFFKGMPPSDLLSPIMPHLQIAHQLWTHIRINTLMKYLRSNHFSTVPPSEEQVFSPSAFCGDTLHSNHSIAKTRFSKKVHKLV
jgi:hypothetical protein